MIRIIIKQLGSFALTVSLETIRKSRSQNLVRQLVYKCPSGAVTGSTGNSLHWYCLCNRLPGVKLNEWCWAESSRTWIFWTEDGHGWRNHLACCEVTLLSNYNGAHPVTEADRWDHKQKMITKVPCPAVVKEYNKYMVGVVLLHSLVALYWNKIRSTPQAGVPFPGYDHRDPLAALPNRSWRLCHEKAGTRKAVYLQVIYCWRPLPKWKESARRVVRFPQLLVSMTRRGEKGLLLQCQSLMWAHWIIVAKKKGRCKVPARTSTPKAKWRKCDVHLCFTTTSNCFLNQ